MNDPSPDRSPLPQPQEPGEPALSLGGEQGGSDTSPASTEPSQAPADGPLPLAMPIDAATLDTSLLPRGNKLHLVRGGLTTLIASLVSIALMSRPGHLAGAVPIGLSLVLVAAIGVLDLLGTFDDPAARITTRRALPELLPPLSATIVTAAIAFALLSAATAGWLPILASALLIPASLTALVAAVYKFGERLGPWATDEREQPRGLLARHGFWVVTVAIWLYVPMAGNHSLTDPWETHYGEVSREILSRDDWISTWWAQDGWFFSKPVLNFWLQALAMSALGVKFMPDQMLAAAGSGPTPRPEWAVRSPVVLLTIVALYLLYKGVARVFGRRAGLLGALVLMTMPQWAMLSHQTMADMPFVAAMSSAMGLLMLGIYASPTEQARVYEVELFKRRVGLSAYHLVFGVILVSALPQIFYLLSRNLEVSSLGFTWHLDGFSSGSRGNCGLPGNEACVVHRATLDRYQPALQALAWTGVLGLLLYLNWGERRIQRLCYLGAFYFAAVSTLGKGPAGLVIPVLCACAYVAVTGRWRELSRLELLSGLLIVLAVALPWYVAMFMRHGPPFIDRLIFHDMWKRALTHVHDTNEGDDVSFRFYVWQLGYAAFPWTGLLPLALTWWARKPDDADRGKGDASVFLAMWFVFSFALFTWMLTKFHHYIFPAVPPAAMLVGVLLDRLIGGGSLVSERKSPSLLQQLALFGGTLLVAYGVFRFFPGSLDGYRSDGAVRPPSPAIAALCLLAGGALTGWGALPLLRRSEALDQAAPDAQTEEPTSDGPDEQTRLSFENVLLGGAAIASAALVLIVGRDMVVRPAGDVIGDARLMHLFTYNYKRPWPESLDFTGLIAAVTVVAAALCLLLAVRKTREMAGRMLIALSLGWAVFCLDDYFVKTAPHWGQRETIEAYYKHRAGPEEPIIAYQMNWKGENFYTGNRLPAFVSSGEKFKTYIKALRDKGTRTFFFTTEHSRVASLKAELGNPSDLAVLTDRRLNNKFTLVRVRFQD